MSYNIAVEQILTSENSSSPFNIKVWTDNNQFRIGEPVVFYFKSDRDCYITLLDQGTSGALRVIFPNPYQKDNLIQAGKTYAVPDKSAGYAIKVDGPPGIERVKIIASLDNRPEDKDNERVRDLSISLNKLDAQQWAEGYHEITILTSEGTETWRPRKLITK